MSKQRKQQIENEKEENEDVEVRIKKPTITEPQFVSVTAGNEEVTKQPQPEESNIRKDNTHDIAVLVPSPVPVSHQYAVLLALTKFM